MRDKKQEFTRREIEIDLKNVYKTNTYYSCIALVATLVGMGIVALCLTSTEKNIAIMWFLFSLTILINIGIFAYIGYNIYSLFAPQKYKIASDVFVNEAIDTVYVGSRLKFTCFHFKTYGNFRVNFAHSPKSYQLNFSSNYKKFYKWSNLFFTDSRGLRKSTSPGDEFYLIIINNKIKYIYNKKIFEFKETEKA